MSGIRNQCLSTPNLSSQNTYRYQQLIVPVRALFFTLVAFRGADAARPFSANSHIGIVKTSAAIFKQIRVGDDLPVPISLLALRGGATSTANDLIGPARDWMNNLASPAALVAGAVVGTLYENMRGGALDIDADDTIYVKYAKKATFALLISSFGFQITSIFVTTISGTMFLSQDFSNFKTTATAPLAFLREHFFEFEYLTSRLGFLQGLMNWLAAVAIESTIPRPTQSIEERRMNTFCATSLATLMLLLFSFYNDHMTFYSNYFEMISRWCVVASNRYLRFPKGPLVYLYVPALMASLYTGVRAFAPMSRESWKK